MLYSYLYSAKNGGLEQHFRRSCCTKKRQNPLQTPACQKVGKGKLFLQANNS